MKRLTYTQYWISFLIVLAQTFSSWGASPPPEDLVPTPVPNPSPTPYAAWTNGPSDQANYFPIGVWLQSPFRAVQYKAAGMNLYIGLRNGPTEAHLADLTQAGMPVMCAQNSYARDHLDNSIIVGWTQIDEPDNAKKFATYWESNPSLIAEAWPEYAGQSWGTWGPPASPTQVTNSYLEMKGFDDSRPVFMNLSQGVAWDEWVGRGVRTGHMEDYPLYAKGGDILGFDIYPVVSTRPEIAGELWRVPYGTQRLRGWDEEKPTWAFIECTHINNATVKPTPSQVRSEVWMALIFGARGIVYFVHQFQPSFIEAALLADPEMLLAVTAINAQIQSLASVLAQPSITSNVEVVSAIINTPVRAMIKQHDGAMYIFSAAMYDEPTVATFNISGVQAPLSVEVLGEGRTLVATNGVFSDAFGSNDVHIYRAEILESEYQAWASSYGLANAMADKDYDVEADGMDNFLEYVLGGNPTNNDARVIQPTAKLVNGVAWEYVYRRQRDAVTLQLTYDLQYKADLGDPNWVSSLGLFETGTKAADSTFDVVTNTIPLEMLPGVDKSFIKLEVRGSF